MTDIPCWNGQGAMTRLHGTDFLIALEPAPDGLQEAFLLHLEGRVPKDGLFDAYRRLGEMAAGPVLNLVVVNVRLELQLDYDEFAAIHRGLRDRGVRHLNLAVANPEPASRHLVSFGDEVGRQQGLGIESRVFADRAAAVAGLRVLMAETPDMGRAAGGSGSRPA